MNPISVMAQAMINNLIRQNPAAQQALPFIQGKSSQQLEQTARNLCKERGVDVDQMYRQVQSMLQQNMK